MYAVGLNGQFDMIFVVFCAYLKTCPVRNLLWYDMKHDLYFLACLRSFSKLHIKIINAQSLWVGNFTNFWTYSFLFDHSLRIQASSKRIIWKFEGNKLFIIYRRPREGICIVFYQAQLYLDPMRKIHFRDINMSKLPHQYTSSVSISWNTYSTKPSSQAVDFSLDSILLSSNLYVNQTFIIPSTILMTWKSQRLDDK